jgi:hypothetical protein
MARWLIGVALVLTLASSQLSVVGTSAVSIEGTPTPTPNGTTGNPGGSGGGGM